MKNPQMLWRGLQIAAVVAILGVVALGLTFLGAQTVAQAQGPATGTPGATAQPTAQSCPTVTNTNTIGSSFWAALAAKLNVSVDNLKAAALQVRKDMLDQAVKDGRATQAQVDQLKQRLNADNLIAPINLGRGNLNPQQPNPRVPGQLPNPGRGRGFGVAPNQKQNPGLGVAPRLGARAGQSLAVLEATAKALNLSASELVNQLSSGKTLADIATAQKVDQAKLKQTIVDTRNAEIDRQVTDGLITQAQANMLKSQVTTSTLDLTRPLFSLR